MVRITMSEESYAYLLTAINRGALADKYYPIDDKMMYPKALGRAVGCCEMAQVWLENAKVEIDDAETVERIWSRAQEAKPK